MCLNLHPDFIITDCVFHYCFGITGPGDMHLKNYKKQIYTILFNQQKSMKINTYKCVFIQATKTQFAFIHHSKGEILWGKKQWNYYWVILLRQFLIHDIFFQISNIVTENFYCIPSKLVFFFALRKELSFMFSNPRCISIMRMR